MPSIRVYSSRRWNPKKKEWDYSIYYRTLESIERAGAEALSNWYGVEESDLDEDGKILAKTIHKMMNPPDGKLIKVKPTIDALKAMKEVIPASHQD